MDVSWLVLGVMLAISAANLGADHLKMNPKRALIPKDGTTVIKCNIELPATECSFHVWNFDLYKKSSIPVKPMDFKTVNSSDTQKRPTDEGACYQGSYHGDSLQKGQCGVKLTVFEPGAYFVGCRVRTATSGWTYDYMALVVHEHTRSPKVYSNMTDIEMVNVGEKEDSKPIDFAVNLRSNRQCKLLLPVGGVLVPKASDPNEKTDNNYKAKWKVIDGALSVTLLDVTSGGPLWCLCRDDPEGEYTEFDVKVITVLKAPNSTEFIELARTNFTEGENLNATCIAKIARPVAKIVWRLGDDVIRNDPIDDNVDDARMDIDPQDPNEPRGDWLWRWPWSTKSIKQVLHHELTLKDSGKQLTCQVLHPALFGGLWNTTSSVITVNARTSSNDGNTESPAEGNNTNSDNDSIGLGFRGGNGFLYFGMGVGVVVVAVIIGAFVFYQRRRRLVAPRAAKDPTDCTSFIEENDLYQSHNDTCLVNKHTPGAGGRGCFIEENDLYDTQDNRQASGIRASIQAENPYEELNIAPFDSHPSTATSHRISPTYGNTVHYAEVTIGPSNGAKPPPKKPVNEACVYAEVKKIKPPKS